MASFFTSSDKAYKHLSEKKVKCGFKGGHLWLVPASYDHVVVGKPTGAEQAFRRPGEILLLVTTRDGWAIPWSVHPKWFAEEGIDQASVPTLSGDDIAALHDEGARKWVVAP